jgi:hypothetical protein
MNSKSMLIGIVVVCILVIATAASVIAKDPFSRFKQFEAMGTAGSETCNAPVAMTGTLRGNVVGTGAYHLCLISAANAKKGPSPGGTLVFTDDEGTSSFTLDVAREPLQNSSSVQTYTGTYLLDPTQCTGKFVNDLLNGSGNLEFSATGRNDTIVLHGILVGK